MCSTGSKGRVKDEQTGFQDQLQSLNLNPKSARLTALCFVASMSTVCKVFSVPSCPVYHHPNLTCPSGAIPRPPVTKISCLPCSCHSQGHCSHLANLKDGSLSLEKRLHFELITQVNICYVPLNTHVCTQRGTVVQEAHNITIRLIAQAKSEHSWV